MDWSTIIDALFLAGSAASAAFLVYGGWLCRYGWAAAPARQDTKDDAIDLVPPSGRLSELSSTVALPLLALVLTLAAGGASTLA